VQEIIDALLGRKPLPWEEDGVREEKLGKLRMLRSSLTRCLSRNPADRPTAEQLLASWNRLFEDNDKTVLVTPSEGSQM
jgi:serine/threonine protein kinase